MTQDEQEALSRAHGRDVIVVLPLRSGNLAVYNAKRELCGIIPMYERWCSELIHIWKPPVYAKPQVDLKELGLL